MIIGIGVDSAEIDRFTTWNTYPKPKLRHVFSDDEIAYCLSNKTKSAERFAVRHAAKEAFFKALSSTKHKKIIPFLTVCKYIQVKKDLHGKPSLIAHWEMLAINVDKKPDIIHLSITHSNTIAIAFVVLEKQFKTVPLNTQL